MYRASLIVLLSAAVCVACLPLHAQEAGASLRGIVRDGAGKPIGGATVEVAAIRATSVGTAIHHLQATTDSEGIFRFPNLSAGDYTLSITWQDRTLKYDQPLRLPSGERMAAITISADQLHIEMRRAERPEGSPPAQAETEAAGGTNLTRKQVSNLPLNKRDFTKLLALAGGTTTDTNGANNFTLQFAINGQRGTTAVFAMDGVYTTDPEMGGATFSNFNVDAIEEIQSQSGVMPPEIGAGAAGYTNVVTKSGSNQIHGDVFEFLRNAALDARNFFDRRSFASPGRIPPFQRNEFGFTLGGPVTLPGIYDGHGRTYFFGQYQGFRQVLGTTQVLSVPTAAERQGIDTLTFPGDTLTVPVNPAIAPVLKAIRCPTTRKGRSATAPYATSSKVVTNSDQASIRHGPQRFPPRPNFSRDSALIILTAL